MKPAAGSSLAAVEAADVALDVELRRLDAVREWLRNPRHNVIPYPLEGVDG